jgi:hypothetical protein
MLKLLSILRKSAQSHMLLFVICMCSHLEKKYLDSLTLKPLGLYVNLVGHFVAYLQPFDLVYR